MPQSGTASFELIGDLTVRDVTRRVTWEATATFNGPDANVQAKTAFRFADFGLTIPRVSSVLSVEDNIRLEADFLLRQLVKHGSELYVSGVRPRCALSCLS